MPPTEKYRLRINLQLHTTQRHQINPFNLLWWRDPLGCKRNVIKGNVLIPMVSSSAFLPINNLMLTFLFIIVTSDIHCSDNYSTNHQPDGSSRCPGKINTTTQQPCIIQRFIHEGWQGITIIKSYTACSKYDCLTSTLRKGQVMASWLVGWCLRAEKDPHSWGTSL